MINHKIWYEENKPAILKRISTYWKAEQGKIVQKRIRLRLYKKYKQKESFVLECRLRSRLTLALNGKLKSAPTLELLGCSIEKLKRHIEKQFVKGMSWKSRSKWHLDHILPIASFDLTKESEQKKCFNYKNLQPLWAIDNLRKKDKV